MTQLIIKTDLTQGKMEALLHFLKSWGIEAEVKLENQKSDKPFSLSSGIWNDLSDEDANSLRIKAWGRGK